MNEKMANRGMLLALTILLVSSGVSFSCEIHIKETIHYDFTFPLDHHTYDYASIVDFYYGKHPDSFLHGIFIGTTHWSSGFFSLGSYFAA